MSILNENNEVTSSKLKDSIVCDGIGSSSNALSMVQDTNRNNNTNLTDLFLQQNCISELNINDSSNVIVGNVLNVHGDIKINQYIIEQKVEASKATKDDKSNTTTIITEGDHYDTDDDEPELNSQYDNIIPDFHIVTKKEWKARRSGPVDMLELPVEYVVIAHTATETCPTKLSNIYHVRYIQNIHMDLRRWSDIGYNFLIGGDGDVYEGRGWDTVGAHSRKFNKMCICIAFIGTFCQVLPPKWQLDGAKKLIELCLAAGKLTKDYKLIGHRQVIPTLSPGELLFQEIQNWPHYCEGEIMLQ